MEYNKDGELTEVYYYNKVVLNEQEGTRETGQSSETVEFRMPHLGLKKKPSKYKKPKVPPKVSFLLYPSYVLYNNMVLLCS